MDITLQLDNAKWEIGAKIGEGGFGSVFVAKSDGVPDAVAKFIPRVPGSDRELEFVNLSGVRNVVPILDKGSNDDSWVIIMPRAEMSLHDYLERNALPLDLEESKAILIDISTALEDLKNRSDPVVHRDLKPKNVLRLNGTWCLADFGISRYAEATTAADTRKEILSQSYAAPERWNWERATDRTDIYSLGVVAYFLCSGQLPFSGPSRDDFRHQHLHGNPPTLQDVPASFAALVSECLYKAPEERPSATDFLSRVSRINPTRNSSGIIRLEQANLAEVTRKAVNERIESERRSEETRRINLRSAARSSYQSVSEALRTSITDAAPAATVQIDNTGGWVARLGGATLDFAPMQPESRNEWNHWGNGFDVIAYATVSLSLPPNSFNYDGRSHSLWFCDVVEEGEYGWYEVAFMDGAVMARASRWYPYALRPGEASAKALSRALTEFDVARPFKRLTLGDLDEFLEFWMDTFGDAANGEVPHPNQLPEMDRGSWRTTGV